MEISNAGNIVEIQTGFLGDWVPGRGAWCLEMGFEWPLCDATVVLSS